MSGPRSIASEPRNTFNDAKVEAFGYFVVFGDRLRRNGHRTRWGTVPGRWLTQEAFLLVSKGKAKERAEFQRTETIPPRKGTGTNFVEGSSLAKSKLSDLDRDN